MKVKKVDFNASVCDDTLMLLSCCYAVLFGKNTHCFAVGKASRNINNSLVPSHIRICTSFNV